MNIHENNNHYEFLYEINSNINALQARDRGFERPPPTLSTVFEMFFQIHQHLKTAG